MSGDVSVAMTSCNGEKYIGEQIDSLLRQQLRPSEIIVCDDASTDGTLAILETYANDGLLALYKNEERLGVIANFKKAVGLCREGNAVALCDQDDYWHADKLSQSAALLATIDESKAGIVFSDLIVTDERLQEIAPSFLEVLDIEPLHENLRSLLFGNFITGCTVVMNAAMRRIFLEMPDAGVTMHDAWLGQVAFSFGEYRFLKKPMLKYRQHGRNVTFNTNQRSTLMGKVIRNVRQMLGNAGYLNRELTLADTFYRQYEAKLTPVQKSAYADFLALRQASFFKKKTSARAARAYRRAPGKLIS